MHTFLRNILFAALILALPVLATAADTAPAIGTKPAASVEIPQKATMPAITASKPSDATATRQAVKIGYADMVLIAGESKPGKALQDKLKGKKDKLQAKIDAKRKQLDKMRAVVEAKLPTLTPPQREAKYREFQKKVEEFQKMGKESEEELYKLQESEGKILYAEIEQAAEVYGKANGFDLIVIKKEVLYIGNGVDAQDVTKELMKMMDEGYKK